LAALVRTGLAPIARGKAHAAEENFDFDLAREKRAVRIHFGTWRRRCRAGARCGTIAARPAVAFATGEPAEKQERAG
jgi:hypothetical protein